MEYIVVIVINKNFPFPLLLLLYNPQAKFDEISNILIQKNKIFKPLRLLLTKIKNTHGYRGLIPEVRGSMPEGLLI